MRSELKSYSLNVTHNEEEAQLLTGIPAALQGNGGKTAKIKGQTIANYKNQVYSLRTRGEISSAVPCSFRSWKVDGLFPYNKLL